MKNKLCNRCCKHSVPGKPGWNELLVKAIFVPGFERQADPIQDSFQENSLEVHAQQMWLNVSAAREVPFSSNYEINSFCQQPYQKAGCPLLQINALISSSSPCKQHEKTMCTGVSKKTWATLYCPVSVWAVPNKIKIRDRCRVPACLDADGSQRQANTYGTFISVLQSTSNQDRSQ